MIECKRQPTHPGVILKKHYLGEIGVSTLARRTGLPRQMIDRIIREESRVTARTALLFSRALNTSPDLWLNLQQALDLWKARRELGFSSS